jgi:hypothetical protein
MKKLDHRVVKIDEVNSAHLFLTNSLLLGDGKGDYFVVDEEGTPFGRYEHFLDAKEHCDNLNEPQDINLANKSTDELIANAYKLLKDIKNV